MECSKYKHCKTILWNYLLSTHLSYSCPLHYSKHQMSVSCLLSLPAASLLWLPQSCNSWTFSLLRLGFTSVFIKTSPFFLLCFFLIFSFYIFKCNLFLFTGNDHPIQSVLLSIFKLQFAYCFAEQVQERLSSSICWKELCTCSSEMMRTSVMC